MNANNLNLIQGAAAIDKAIASIKTRGAKLDGDIQRCGLSVLAHTAEHGDTGVMDRLVDAMPKSARRTALVEWMLAFGKARLLDRSIKDEAEAIKAGRIFQYEKERTLDLQQAQERPWFKFKPEPSITTAIDAQAVLHATLERLKKAAKTGLTIEHKAEALAEAKALVALIEADFKVEEAKPLRRASDKQEQAQA